MAKKDFKNLRVVTGRVRFHYVNLFEPREAFGGSTPKYGMCVMVSKGDVETLDNINRVIETALQVGEEIWAEESLNNLIIPLRDGDVERTDKPEFEGCYFKAQVFPDCCCFAKPRRSLHQNQGVVHYLSELTF
jgi:hypothetical protein